MKKILVMLLALAFLTGCPREKPPEPDPEDTPIKMRPRPEDIPMNMIL